jgi:hypothetical protein
MSAPRQLQQILYARGDWISPLGCPRCSECEKNVSNVAVLGLKQKGGRFMRLTQGAGLSGENCASRRGILASLP